MGFGSGSGNFSKGHYPNHDPEVRTLSQQSAQLEPSIVEEGPLLARPASFMATFILPESPKLWSVSVPVITSEVMEYLGYVSGSTNQMTATGRFELCEVSFECVSPPRHLSICRLQSPENWHTVRSAMDPAAALGYSIGNYSSCLR